MNIKENIYYMNRNIQQQTNNLNNKIKEDKKENNTRLKLRKLKNDIMHIIAEDLKSNVNVFDLEYQEKLFDKCIYDYFKEKNDIELARLELDESFLNIYNKARRLNEEEEKNTRPKISFAELCSINNKIFEEYRIKPEKKKNKNAFILFLNMILSPWNK